jgi:serine/threonine protein kinase
MDAHAERHPSDQALSSFGLGKLDDRSAGAINKHLEQCADCRKRVAEMSADSFLGRIREAQKPAGHSMSEPSQPAATKSYKATNGPTPPPAHTLPPGLVDHPDYEIKRELGRGGMGVVYLAHNKWMGRDEVLKVMGRHIMERPGVLERFQREIRAVAKLRHPNIVTAYHATRIDESLVFAMEYVVGLDLSRMVKAKGPMPISRACYFAHQTALGLQHAHEEGMVHRDIKPGNLMLTHRKDTATIKILDFGLAKLTREEKVDGTLTFEGQALGTPDFIAPEQILDAPSADIRADIYSLGGTLFYLLTGRPPFQANSLYDIYQAHISRDADFVNFVRPEVPSELAALVAKMMAKDPARRFQIPGEVAQALAVFFRRRTAACDGLNADNSPTGLSTIDRSVVEAFPTSDHVKSEPSARTARSKKIDEPTIEAARWEGLIQFRTAERSADIVPGVAFAKRIRWRPLPVLIAVSVLGLAALGVITVKGWYAGTRTIARDNKPSEVKATDVVARSSAAVALRPSTTATIVHETPQGAETLSRVGNAKSPSNVTAADGWVSLFNGKDKTGWKTHPSQTDNWRVIDGVLRASGPDVSHLYTERDDYKDVHIRVEARIGDGASGGVHLRSGFGPARPKDKPMFPISYEAPINCTHPNANKTGSLYLPDGNAVNCPNSPVPPGEWMILEMIATGRHITIKVNGNVTTDYLEGGPSYPQEGHIALLRYSRLGAEQYRPESLIEFRKIEIKVLKGGNLELEKTSPPLSGRNESFDLSKFAVRSGQWGVEGNELIQADERAVDCLLSFGDEGWTDYDFTVDAMRVSGTDCFSLLFRYTDPGNHVKFTVSGHGNKLTYLEPHHLGKPAIPRWTDFRIQDRKWYTASVSVRGNHFTAFLFDHDSGTKTRLFDLDDDRLPTGSVGLFTWTSAYKFKNIRVTSPEGRVLWNGLPAIESR